MVKFPVDVPKAKVIKTLEFLGFTVIREPGLARLKRY
jgi:hypothetical protein